MPTFISLTCKGNQLKDTVEIYIQSDTLMRIYGILKCKSIIGLFHKTKEWVNSRAALWLMKANSIHSPFQKKNIVLEIWPNGKTVLYCYNAGSIWSKWLHIRLVVCVCVCVHACTHVLRCVWLFVTPWSPPGFSVHGILHARILEQVAISCSRGSSQPRDWT